MKLQAKIFTSFGLCWTEVPAFNFCKEDVKFDKLDFIDHNESLYNVIKDFEDCISIGGERISLSYNLVEAAFSRLTEYDIDNDNSELNHLITKYEVTKVADHATVGYILVGWYIEDGNTFEFNSKVMEYLDEHFKGVHGITTNYTVKDEDDQLLWRFNFKLDPLKVMLGGVDPFINFGGELYKRLDRIVSINGIGLEPKFRLNPETREFEFETVDGQRLKVICDQYIKAADAMDDFGFDPDKD